MMLKSSAPEGWLDLSIRPIGLLFHLPQPVEAADWLCRNMSFSVDQREENQVIIVKGNCRIVLKATDQPVLLQNADEGYFTGLAHIAFATGDIRQSVDACMRAGIKLAGGEAISSNPGIWGTGMYYINPVWDHDVQLEISQRLDLPAFDNQGAPISGLEHVGMPVADMVEATVFYRQLGFEEMTATTINREDGAIIFCTMMSFGDLTIELFEFAGMQHEHYADQPFAALLFETDDLDGLLEACSHANIKADRTSDTQMIIRGVNGEKLIVEPFRT